MTETKPTGFVPTPITQPYVSSNPRHRFRFLKTSAKCSCGWNVWQVGRELAERSHFKHLKQIADRRV